MRGLRRQPQVTVVVAVLLLVIALVLLRVFRDRSQSSVADGASGLVGASSVSQQGEDSTTAAIEPAGEESAAGDDTVIERAPAPQSKSGISTKALDDLSVRVQELEESLEASADERERAEADLTTRVTDLESRVTALHEKDLSRWHPGVWGLLSGLLGAGLGAWVRLSAMNRRTEPEAHPYIAEQDLRKQVEELQGQMRELKEQSRAAAAPTRPPPPPPPPSKGLGPRGASLDSGAMQARVYSPVGHVVSDELPPQGQTSVRTQDWPIGEPSRNPARQQAPESPTLGQGNIGVPEPGLLEPRPHERRRAELRDPEQARFSAIHAPQPETESLRRFTEELSHLKEVDQELWGLCQPNVWRWFSRTNDADVMGEPRPTREEAVEAVLVPLDRAARELNQPDSGARARWLESLAAILGLSPMFVAPGMPFRSSEHRAQNQLPAGTYSDLVVAQVTSDGYRRRDGSVFRHAAVVIRADQSDTRY